VRHGTGDAFFVLIGHGKLFLAQVSIMRPATRLTDMSSLLKHFVQRDFHSITMPKWVVFLLVALMPGSVLFLGILCLRGLVNCWTGRIEPAVLRVGLRKLYAK
jgi:hypothetical protein